MKGCRHEADDRLPPNRDLAGGERQLRLALSRDEYDNDKPSSESGALSYRGSPPKRSIMHSHMNSPTGQKRVYLDVCALCRPFDDQSLVRIRLETIAIELILDHVRQREIEMIVSPAHAVEIEAIVDLEERRQLISLIEQLGTPPRFDLSAARKRAEYLADHGLGVADAAHLAFAEQAQADLITVDDRLIKRSKRVRSAIWCDTPPAYCEKESLR